MKNGLSRSEQRTVSKTQKQPLDRKSPIQVRCEPDFRGRIPSMIVGVPTSRASFLTGDRGFESTYLQRGVCLSSEPRGCRRKAPHFGGGLRWLGHCAGD